MVIEKESTSPSQRLRPHLVCGLESLFASFFTVSLSFERERSDEKLAFRTQCFKGSHSAHVPSSCESLYPSPSTAGESFTDGS